MTNGEKIKAQLSYESAVYQEQLHLLQKEIERVNITTVDLNHALRTAQQLKQEDILVPVGGGAFIKSSVYTTKMLVPIGADYLVEIEKDAAIVEINKRMEATKKAIEKLSEEFQKVSVKLRELNIKLKEVQTQDIIDRRVEGNIGEDYI